jgi:hypothetical protein
VAAEAQRDSGFFEQMIGRSAIAIEPLDILMNYRATAA